MPEPIPDRGLPTRVVQRLRVRYARRGRMRFTSHRDFARALERALRRAAVPVAYSAGFSPHPRVSYVGAAATGAASEAEYLELGLATPCDPAAVAAALDRSLPEGLDVVEAVVAGPGSLAERIDASLWQITLNGVSSHRLQSAWDLLLAQDAVRVTRIVKDGRREFDVRAAIVSGSVRRGPGPGDDCGILQMVVRQVTPAVRPDDVLTGLRQVADLAPPVPPGITRLAQGLLDDSGGLADPLGPDRALSTAGEDAATVPQAAGVAEYAGSPDVPAP